MAKRARKPFKLRAEPAGNRKRSPTRKPEKKLSMPHPERFDQMKQSIVFGNDPSLLEKCRAKAAKKTSNDLPTSGKTNPQSTDEK
jgi:hypothetical protein